MYISQPHAQRLQRNSPIYILLPRYIPYKHVFTLDMYSLNSWLPTSNTNLYFPHLWTACIICILYMSPVCPLYAPPMSLPKQYIAYISPITPYIYPLHIAHKTPIITYVHPISFLHISFSGPRTNCLIIYPQYIHISPIYRPYSPQHNLYISYISYTHHFWGPRTKCFSKI